MFSRVTLPSTKSVLSSKQALELCNIYLENASKTTDHDITLVLCHDAETALAQVKNTSKKALTHPKDTGEQALREGVAAAYIGLGKLLDSQGYPDEAQAIYKKAEKLGGDILHPGLLVQSTTSDSIVYSVKASLDSTKNTSAVSPSIRAFGSQQKHQQHDIAIIPPHIFANDARPLSMQFKLPEPDECLNSTPQLACCLELLQASLSPSDVLEPAVTNWLQAIEKDKDEQERLKMLTMDIIRVFKRDELKDAKAVAEVVCLSPILDKDAFRDLLNEFYSGVDRSGLLDFHQLEGLAQLIQGADPTYLDADDLVKILNLLSTRLRDTHQQSQHHIYQLTITVSHVLDAMANTKLKDLDREKLQEPLASYLDGLKSSNDPYLVYQAAYAYQALLCVPDDEKLWQTALRRTGKVIQGVSGLVSAVKALDLNKFIEGLGNIQQGFTGASGAFQLARSAYENVTSLAKSGQELLDCLKEGLNFERKCRWYSALRGADAFIRNGELASFKKLVCEVSCRCDAAFQWGVCQRLGEIAANPMWDADTRRSAVAFLGEIYQNDAVWGQHVSVKQWIVEILMQLASPDEDGLQLHATIAETLLLELEADQDAQKQVFCQSCREKGPNSHPLKVALPVLESSLLDRVQNRPDVEGNLRMLRKQRLKERGNAVYVQPQAKASIVASDDSGDSLMEKVKDFLSSDRKVFLLLGDCGAGKSTFNRELEYELWQTYKKEDRVPLHINLPAIDKPEHDVIAKQLRKAEFTEPQIRELKLHRKFILICDGYDESQQTHNIYMSNRLNQPGEWDAQMVISCRTEYLGVDYRDRFQPGERNKPSESSLFQEAVIAPFSLDQVQAYIKQYVSVYQPMWQTEDYNNALELIPTLKDLMENPFLMALSLEVLPRMMGIGERLTVDRVTRVSLYDQFVVQWLEREKKRLGDKPMSAQTRAAFESLSDEGFTLNGIRFLKKLAMAIYKEQGGHPIVSYSRDKDEDSWKVKFFSREDDKQLLREACPLKRSGNQYRFIHRSLLEYGLALAVFDPQDWNESTGCKPILSRRGSMSSTLSFEIDGFPKSEAAAVEQEPDINSPLMWRNSIKDGSLLQFLEERAQQEPVFKQQLLSYIEHSKTDKKWRIAAANAMTILVRTGVQFNNADLRGIQIPGADLSYGVFDSVKLQGADLRKVDLRGVWLRESNLSGAQMTGVQFGELPFLEESHFIFSCAYSPDATSFAVGLYNGNINVYSTSKWERTRTLSGHRGEVTSVVFSPRGGQIASSSWDETIRLWDVESEACLRTLSGHSNVVISVAYSPQGNKVVSASSDKTVRIWNVETGDCIRTLTGHTYKVSSAVYSPNGNYIASSSDDNTIKLWDSESGVCCIILNGHSAGVNHAVYSPHGDLIASASGDMTVRIWDVENGACRHILTGHTSGVCSVAFSPKGEQIATGSEDRSVRLWDSETGICRGVLTGHSLGVVCVVFSPKGDQLASSGSWDMKVRLWGVSVGVSRFVSNGHSTSVRSVKCSPKGDQIATSSDDSTIRLWDVETGVSRLTLRGHSKRVDSVAYSPQGDQLVSGSFDKSVRLWDVGVGTCSLTLTGHSDSVCGVAYSPKGGQVASASDDRTVRLWDILTGECLQTLTGHLGYVYNVVYSPKGNQVATGSFDNTVRLWDVETGICNHTLSGHSDYVLDVVYSPCGDLIASASGDKTVQVWDVETGTCRPTMTDHTGPVTSVAYSPKGDLLASGSYDKTVRLWDVSSGQCRKIIQNFQSFIRSIVWCASTDANYLATGCEDGSVFMWQIIQEGDVFRSNLRWSSASGKLAVAGVSIQDVHGLSQLNKQLLQQRKAVGEPVHRLREASKKTISMVSAVSKLKLSSSGTAQDPTSTANSSVEPSDQGIEQQP